MTRAYRFILAALVAASVAFCLQAGLREDRVALRAAQGEIARRDSQLVARAVEVERLQGLVAQLEAQRKADEGQAVVAIERWRTLVDTLEVTDTVRVQDVVEAGTQLATACSRALGSCGAAVASRDSLLQVQAQRVELLQLQLEAEISRRPSRRAQLWHDVKAAAVGAAAASILHSIR